MSTLRNLSNNDGDGNNNGKHSNRKLKLKFSPGQVGFTLSALTLFPGLFTVPLMRMTDLLSELKFFKITTVYVPVYISELTRT